MQYKNEEAFSKAWKAGTRHRAYFLWGAENYLIERWQGQLSKEAGDGAFNLHIFDGKKLDVDDLAAAVEALPLMAATTCAIVDDLDWKGLGVTGQKKLTELLDDLPEDCLLVATAKAPGFDAKAAGSKKLLGLFDKAGCTVELGSRGTGGLSSFLKAEAKRLGCALSGDLCKHILATCENDMLTLKSEMAKLCAYAGGGELTKAQVDAVCTPKTEARVYDLSKAILAGNADRALGLLDALFYLRESGVMIVAVLSRAFVDLYRARVAKGEGKTSAEVAAQFGYRGREFVVRAAFSDSSNLSPAYLCHCLGVLQQCDRRLKSSSVEDRVLVEQVVVELMALAGQYR